MGCDAKLGTQMLHCDSQMPRFAGQHLEVHDDELRLAREQRFA